MFNVFCYVNTVYLIKYVDGSQEVCSSVQNVVGKIHLKQEFTYLLPISDVFFPCVFIHQKD